MKTSDLILKRYSPLAFSDKEINEQLLLKLFEAARWAPSAFNEQPWRFLYCHKNDHDRYIKLFDCLVDANKEWAKTAPVLILVLAKKNFSHNNQPNYFHMYDTGMAFENFIISALEEEIFVHQMGGFSAEKARKNFNIPEEYAIISLAAVGYPGNVAILSEPLQQRAQKPRTRKNITELFLG